MKEYKVIDLNNTEKVLPDLIEYMSYKKEKNKDMKDFTIMEFISSLKFNKIFAPNPDNVLPFIVDENYFICATDGNNSTIIQDTLDFINKHENNNGLKKLTIEDEFTGKYLNVCRLIIDGIPYVEV